MPNEIENQLALLHMTREIGCRARRSSNIIQDMRIAAAGTTTADTRRHMTMNEEEFQTFIDAMYQQELNRTNQTPATNEEIEAVERTEMVVEYCSICMDGDSEEEVDARRLRCNHTFHTDCIDQWLRHNAVCPECRAPILEGDDEGDEQQ